MELLIALMIFACVFMLGLGLANLLGRRPEQERLTRLAGGGQRAAADAGGVLARHEPNWLERTMQIFAGRSAREQAADPTGASSVRKRLIHAGYRSDTALVTYMGSRVVLAIGLPMLFLLTPMAWGLEQLQLAAATCTAAGVGLIAPSYWLDRKVAARQKALQLALPDALDLMVVCVEAGLGINASLKRVADDFARTHPVMASEFELVVFETRAGKSTTQALRGLADRTGVSDVSSLVAMLIQTERFGTGLADTLRVHADSMRLRRLQRAEEQANKAPLKMLFPTVFIFVAMLIIVVGPGFLKLSQYFSETNR